MLKTDSYTWSFDEFEGAVEGMCDQLKSWREPVVPFLAHSTPEVIFLFFALWKRNKIAHPINAKVPYSGPLFTPEMPQPKKPRSWDWKEENLATMISTSGSSGAPKLACHTIGNHLYSALGSQKMIPLESGDQWRLDLPLYHVGGIAILFRCYLSRITIALTASLDGITHISLVPTQLYRMQNTPLAKVKCILLGGAPMPPSLPKDLPLFTTYGMTEMSSQIATNGKVLPYAQVRIEKDGEIWVKGKTLFQGYWRENRLDLPIDSGGWFATGDLGKWEDGKLQIIGRKDNMFICGGENIHPENIERAIYQMEGVEQAFVAPREDKEYGMRPVLFVRPLLTLEQVQAHLQGRLPKFQWPIEVRMLPEGIGFKPSRKVLSGLLGEESK
ncbi:MAG: AMP-binding protein [Verrucomicrobia bacterium]|nr:AMP-binding protein [Verrucomicrobiota bacterium]